MKRYSRIISLILCLLMLPLNIPGYAEDGSLFELYNIELTKETEPILSYDEWGYIITGLGNSSYSATVSTTDGYNSSKSMHLKWSPESVTDGVSFRVELPGYEDNRIPADEVGTSYTVSMKIKRIKGSSFEIGGWWTWADGVGISNLKLGEWVEFTHTAEYVGNPEKSARTLMFTLTGDEETELYIDDIVFKRVGSNENLLSENQSTFEDTQGITNPVQNCKIDGRLMGEAECDVTAELRGTGSSVRRYFKTGADGSFSFDFVPEESLYNLTLTAENQRREAVVDLSGVKNLLDIGKEKGYSIERVSYNKELVTATGKHSGVDGGYVTLIANNKDNGEIAAVAQALPDIGGGFELKFNFPESGSYGIKLEAKGLPQVSCDMTIADDIFSIGEDYFAGYMGRLNSYVSELEALIANCREKGIPTDYEEAASEIIREFMQNIEFEKEHGDTRRLGQYLFNLTEIYNIAKADLEAYLRGEKQAFSVPKFQTGKIELNGKSIIAETEYNGIKEKRPVFLTGFGHFETAREEMEFFSKIGMSITNTSFVMEDNSVAAEGRVKSMIIPADGQRNASDMSETEKRLYEKYGVYINYEAADEIRTVLENAERNNMLVEAELGLNFVPKYVLNQDANSQAASTQYLPYAIDNEFVREFIALWSEFVVSVCDEYESAQSVVMINEPAVNGNQIVNGKQYYLPLWHKYLEETYGTFEAYRSAHPDCIYSSFDEVPIPTEMEPTAEFYDYMNFNDGLMLDFQKYLTESIRDTGSDILVSSKVMDYFRYNYPKYFQIGSNYEKLSRYFDINGCDAFSYYEARDNTPMPLKMGWYDYITSVNDMPAWDSESHMLTDLKDVAYNDLIPSYVAADVWNGAVHGRGACVLWLYDHRGVNMPYYERGWGNANSNFAVRPMSLYKISRAAMDLNRLSKEITALQNKEAEVGILYSRTALGYNEEHMKYAGDAYKDIIFSGQKVGFVTDSRPSDMHKYKLLIVPNLTHIPQWVVEELKRYEGEILILGENSLKYDEYGRENASLELWNVNAKIDRTSSVASKIDEMNLSDIILQDAETGERLENVEWSYTEYDGRYIINVINYNENETKKVRVKLGDADIGKMSELRSGEVFDSGIVKAAPYEPILLSVNRLSFDLLDESGNVKKEDLNMAESGIIRCNSTVDGEIILALYKDDVLMSVSIGENEILIPDIKDEPYKLKAAVWNMEKLIPVCSSKEIRTEVVK